ncbi:MAG: hypothetical protein ACRDRV_11060 [Pseudonocardiaceae bacterium]
MTGTRIAESARTTARCGVEVGRRRVEVGLVDTRCSGVEVGFSGVEVGFQAGVHSLAMG